MGRGCRPARAGSRAARWQLFSSALCPMIVQAGASPPVPSAQHATVPTAAAPQRTCAGVLAAPAAAARLRACPLLGAAARLEDGADQGQPVAPLLDLLLLARRGLHALGDLGGAAARLLAKGCMCGRSGSARARVTHMQASIDAQQGAAVQPPTAGSSTSKAAITPESQRCCGGQIAAPTTMQGGTGGSSSCRARLPCLLTKEAALLAILLSTNRHSPTPAQGSTGRQDGCLELRPRAGGRQRLAVAAPQPLLPLVKPPPGRVQAPSQPPSVPARSHGSAGAPGAPPGAQGALGGGAGGQPGALEARQLLHCARSRSCQSIGRAVNGWAPLARWGCLAPGPLAARWS